VISKYVDLGISSEFIKWGLLVLVAFYMEDVGFDGEVGDEGSDGL
jgi:hypothetical protein